MTAAGVTECLTGAPGGDLDPLLAAERAAGAPPDPLVRLAARAGGPPARDLRLSSREQATLAALAPPWNDLGVDPRAWRDRLYALGGERFRGRALLAATAGEAEQLAPRLKLADTWRAPTFPLKGADLLALGATPGPRLGALLAELEDEWRAADFAPDRDTLLAAARRRIGRRP